MKTFLAAVLFFVSCSMGFAQATKGKSSPSKPAAQTPAKQTPPQAPSVQGAMAEHFARKYSIAQRWGDYEVAKDALFDLITDYPGNDSLIFALAYFYFENQKYPSCAMVCNDLLARNSKNVAALELSGISYENLNIKDKALQSFESLFLLTNNNTTLYKMASLQYDLKRYGEVQTNADILLTKPEADSLKVVFNDSKGQPVEYPIRAALHNLKGLAMKAQGDAAGARKQFEEALKVDANFDPAKQNLATLK